MNLGTARGIVNGALADLLVLRPAFALAAVWLTTAGHTASFREMTAARGWVTAESYSLHSIFLLAITLTLLVARLAHSLRQLSAGRRRADDAGGRFARERRAAARTEGTTRARPRARRDRCGPGDPLGPAHSCPPARRTASPGRASCCRRPGRSSSPSPWSGPPGGPGREAFCSRSCWPFCLSRSCSRSPTPPTSTGIPLRGRSNRWATFPRPLWPHFRSGT